MRRLNITDDVLDRLGFSEYWDEHGTFGTRTLTFDDGSQFTIVEQEDMVDEYEDIYISHHFYFCGSFSRPRLEPHITFYLFFLDEMYQCISQYYPHCLEEFLQRCHKAKMKVYLPQPLHIQDPEERRKISEEQIRQEGEKAYKSEREAGNILDVNSAVAFKLGWDAAVKLLQQPPVSDSVKCDYRKAECSNDGKNINGVWVCSNHFQGAKQLSADSLSLGRDKAWDTLSVIAKLVEAADILLHRKDYDGHGWEEIEICYKRGLEILHQS